MKPIAWLVAGWIALAAMDADAAATAQPQAAPPPPQILSVRAWQPSPGDADTFEHAQAVLPPEPATRPAPAGPFEFRLRPERPAWYAITLGPVARRSVLELTHPSIRSAELYIPGAAEPQPAARSGRDGPAASRKDQRFPATLPLPRSSEPQIVYVRMHAVIGAHGQFLVHERDKWELISRFELAAMTMGFMVALLAAWYAIVRAVFLRSPAYFYYCLLTVSLVAAGMFITGLGEATIWPALAAWRGQASALLACVAAGFALLLAERAFALEISAPRFAMLLRVLGIACPAMGLIALPMPLPVQQLVSHFAAASAMLAGMASIWFAWRTHNGPATWLLAGYTPVVLAVALTTAAIAGVIAFEWWMLLALPVAGMLEIPFNLHGLKLLEIRRADVQRSRATLDVLAGNADETREEMVERMALPRSVLESDDPGATLLLLRFSGLAPGAPALGQLDSVAVEQYLQDMMGVAMRPEAQVGRLSHHEILVRDLHHADDGKLDGLITGLFAQALRSERFGIPADVPKLRIAYVRVLAARLPIWMLARRLGRALDDPQRRDMKRIELEAWED